MTRRSAEQRKKEIIAAALDLADTQGPDRMTTNALANAIGLSQAAIFRHFPTKAEIWNGVAEELEARFEARWGKVMEGEGEPLEKIHTLVATQLDIIRATPAIPAILFSRELHADNVPLRGRFMYLVRRLTGLLVELIRQGQASGTLADDVDPTDCALMILGLVQGLALRWSISGRQFDIVEEGRRLLRLQLRGIVR